jgi:hypothetical protein
MAKGDTGTPKDTTEVLCIDAESFSFSLCILVYAHGSLHIATGSYLVVPFATVCKERVLYVLYIVDSGGQVHFNAIV